MEKSIIIEMEQICEDIEELLSKKSYKLAMYNIGLLKGTLETAFNFDQITFDEYNEWYDIVMKYLGDVII
jgi:hypothetical protein